MGFNTKKWSMLRQIIGIILGAFCSLLGLALVNQYVHWLQIEEIEEFYHQDTRLTFADLNFYMPKFEKVESYFELYWKLIDANRGVYADRILREALTVAIERNDLEMQAVAKTYHSKYQQSQLYGFYAPLYRSMDPKEAKLFYAEQYYNIADRLAEQESYAMAAQLIVSNIDDLLISAPAIKCEYYNKLPLWLKQSEVQKVSHLQLVKSDYIKDMGWLDDAIKEAYCLGPTRLTDMEMTLFKRKVKAMATLHRLDCQTECQQAWKAINYIKTSLTDTVIE